MRPFGESRASFSVSEFAKMGRAAIPSRDIERVVFEDRGLIRVEFIKSTAEKKSSFDMTARNERIILMSACY